MVATAKIPQRQLFIDGEWRAPALGRRLPVINPTTEASIGEIPAGTSEDVDAAVAAARAALKRNRGRDWSRAPGAVRAKYLRAIAAKMIERKSDLARLEALDCGKPLDEAAWDMDDVAGCFEFFAGHAEALDKRQNAAVSLPENFKCHLKKEPIGVVALITPCGFSGELSEAKGVISMELTVGSKTLPTAFFVVDVKGRYNVLLGRDWIHANCCIPSTLHQCLIQWIDDDVEVIGADNSTCIALTEAPVDWQLGDMQCLTGRDLSDYDYISIGRDGFVPINVQPTDVARLNDLSI